jgi:hypothetical protein
VLQEGRREGGVVATGQIQNTQSHTHFPLGPHHHTSVLDDSPVARCMMNAQAMVSPCG